MLEKYVKTIDDIYTWRDGGKIVDLSNGLYYYLSLILRDLEFILCKSQETTQTVGTEE